MLKDITLGQYFPGDTPVHRLDPRTKLILTFVFILLVPTIIAIAVSIMALSSGGDAPDMWYILDYASQSVATSINGTVDNGPRDALVMLVWGLVPLIGSYLLFRRREV